MSYSLCFVIFGLFKGFPFFLAITRSQMTFLPFFLLFFFASGHSRRGLLFSSSSSRPRAVLVLPSCRSCPPRAALLLPSQRHTCPLELLSLSSSPTRLPPSSFCLVATPTPLASILRRGSRSFTRLYHHHTPGIAMRSSDHPWPWPEQGRAEEKERSK